MSDVNTTSPLFAAEVMTAASTREAPRTSASVSPTASARDSSIRSTMHPARSFRLGPFWPRHHSARTVAGIVSTSSLDRAARNRAWARGFLRSSATRAPVSSVIPLTPPRWKEEAPHRGRPLPPASRLARPRRAHATTPRTRRGPRLAAPPAAHLRHERTPMSLLPPRDAWPRRRVHRPTKP